MIGSKSVVKGKRMTGIESGKEKERRTVGEERAVWKEEKGGREGGSLSFIHSFSDE
jgi:hypothetical protein